LHADGDYALGFSRVEPPAAEDRLRPGRPAHRGNKGLPSKSEACRQCENRGRCVPRFSPGRNSSNLQPVIYQFARQRRSARQAPVAVRSMFQARGIRCRRRPRPSNFQQRSCGWSDNRKRVPALHQRKPRRRTAWSSSWLASRVSKTEGSIPQMANVESRVRRAAQQCCKPLALPWRSSSSFSIRLQGAAIGECETSAQSDLRFGSKAAHRDSPRRTGRLASRTPDAIASLLAACTHHRDGTHRDEVPITADG
jgi:hypothetical protein